MRRRTPALDFAALPLDEATGLLRDLGLGLLRQALLANADDERPSLADLLPDGVARKLATRQGHRLAPVSYRVTVARATRRGLSPAVWQRRVWSQLRSRIGQTTPGYLPDFLWPTVAERAWASPAFQREAALLARGVLQEQYLFPQGGLPTPVFAPGTFWALLALAQAPHTPALGPALRGLFRRDTLRSPGRLAAQLGRVGWTLWGRLPFSRWEWIPTRATRRRQAARALGQQASVQTLAVSGWAGFWDQYVIMQAILAWHGGHPPLPAALRKGLTDLPVVSEALGHVSSQRTDARGTPPVTTLPLLAHPSWEADRPAWLASQYDPRALVGG
ncbi:MAG: hypothetical protein IT306_06755 [Chloroflexi bacterium]|nr:hypothetical protein [Chloroflexota bacterium]